MSKSLALLAFVALFTACAAEPTPDIQATVDAAVAKALSAAPAPDIQATVDAAVAKALSPQPTAVLDSGTNNDETGNPSANAKPTPTPTPTQVPPTATPTPTPMPTATPTSTSTPTATPLEAFEGTIYIASQTGVMVHDVNWSLINNSRQEVTLGNAEIYNDSGRMVGRMVFGESLALAAGRERSVGTTFMNATEEQVMTYQFVWTFRMHTGETIVCTFSITNPKSCLRNLID